LRLIYSGEREEIACGDNGTIAILSCVSRETSRARFLRWATQAPARSLPTSPAKRAARSTAALTTACHAIVPRSRASPLSLSCGETAPAAPLFARSELAGVRR
jgi:hypothetical protein